MNWTASLLRNQLKKERKSHQDQLELLTVTNEEVQEYLELKKKLRLLERDLFTADENLANLKNQAENTQKEQVKALEAKETQIAKLEKQVKASEELIFDTKKEIRTSQLYFQREIRRVSTELKEQLAQTKKELTNIQQELAEWQGEGEDSIRELKERGKLIAKLEQQTKEQKEQLDLANSKSKQLQSIFKEIITYLNQTLIIRKGSLKEYCQQIQQIMEWEGMASVAATSVNTPAPREE